VSERSESSVDRVDATLSRRRHCTSHYDWTLLNGQLRLTTIVATLTHTLWCSDTGTKSVNGTVLDPVSGRLLRVDLIKWLSILKCPSARPSTKSFVDFNEIWYVCRGRRVMNDGMQYTRSKVKVKVKVKPLKVGNSAIFKGYLLPHSQRGLASDHILLN